MDGMMTCQVQLSYRKGNGRRGCAREGAVPGAGVGPGSGGNRVRFQGELEQDGEYENRILREMTFYSWVQCLVLQCIHALRQYFGFCKYFTHFSTMRQTRILMRFFSSRFEWRSVPSRRFWLQSCYARFAL